MSNISISEFKAHALGLIDSVSKTGREIIITKRGKPLAKVVPLSKRTEKPLPGKLAGTVLFEEDIVTPLGPEMWDSAR